MLMALPASSGCKLQARRAIEPRPAQRAATYAERVRSEAPEYMQRSAPAANSYRPARRLGEDPPAPEYRSTVGRPDCVAVEASRDRLELADKAGALEMVFLDLADTIQADNSMEKLLVHQMAAAHNSAMHQTALVNCRMESMANIIPGPLTMQNIERLKIETCRLAGTVTRMMNTFQQGMEEAERGRSGGEQRVVVERHQYVTRVEDGGQAVIGPKVRTRGGVRNGGGR